MSYSLFEQTVYPGALAAPHSPIVPHTPFPSVKVPSFLSSATPLPPRTPYTPFTAFISTKASSTYSLGSSSGSPYAHLLDNSDEPLARLYSQILRFIERDLSKIMELAEKVSIKSITRTGVRNGGNISPHIQDAAEPLERQGFEIMANVIWEEFGRAIMDELGGIVFSSGRPNEFRKVGSKNPAGSSSNPHVFQHHEFSEAFIRSLEHLAPSAHSIEAMRSHPVYHAFEQRWQLPVYFQMRWKGIIGRLEESLAVTRIEPSSVKGLIIYLFQLFAC